MPSRNKPKKGASRSESALRFALLQRLGYLEELLFWLGEAARFHLQERFRISAQRAALDFAFYRQLHPRNLRYDAVRKRYLPTTGFRPHYYQPDIPAALRRWSAAVSVPQFERPLKPEVVRGIVHAIARGQRCTVQYRSVNSGTTTWREVSAHTFVDDGVRWHVRVFDHGSRKWCDLVLGRIVNVEASDVSSLGVSEDDDWGKEVQIKATPSPALSADARRALCEDYGAADGTLRVTTRKALVFYAAANLGLLRFERPRWEAEGAETRVLLDEIFPEPPER
jgi:hypothetical protein